MPTKLGKTIDGLLKRKQDRLVDDAVVAHIDIVESTSLVRECPQGANRKINFQYERIEKICRKWKGRVLELRGDAMVLLFDEPAHALEAALEIQQANYLANQSRLGFREPKIRIGISQGPVFLDRRVTTGEVIIKAQRLEQLASPGGVMVDRSIYDGLSRCLASRLRACGEAVLKGFTNSTKVYGARSHGRRLKMLA